MANLSPKSGPYAARIVGGSIIPVETQLEASSVSFKVGAPLVFSSGYLTECTSPVTTAAHPTVGLAMRAGNNDTNHSSLKYIPAYQEIVFAGYLMASSGGNSVDTHTLAQTDIGSTMNLAKDGVSGLWFLDFSTTTNGGVIIIDNIDPIGTTKQALVLFKFPNASTSY